MVHLSRNQDGTNNSKFKTLLQIGRRMNLAARKISKSQSQDAVPQTEENIGSKKNSVSSLKKVRKKWRKAKSRVSQGDIVLMDLPNNVSHGSEQNQAIQVSRFSSWKKRARMLFMKKDKEKRKRLPLSERVNSGHLDMEPLCCSSSCFIRGGCLAAGLMEITIITLILGFIMYYLIETKSFWRPILFSYPEMLTHPLLCYILAGFCFVWLAFVGVMFWSVRRFDVRTLKIHYYFQFVVLILSLLIGVILIIYGTTTRKISRVYVGLLAVFLCNAIGKLWCMSVIKACVSYFKMCSVMVTMAGDK